MSCRETIAQLSEYLDAELTPETLARLEAHLGACAPCRAYLATYRKTKDLAAKVIVAAYYGTFVEHLRKAPAVRAVADFQGGPWPRDWAEWTSRRTMKMD